MTMIYTATIILLSSTMVSSSAFMQSGYKLRLNQDGRRYEMNLKAFTTSIDKKERMTLKFVAETTATSDPVPKLSEDELDQKYLDQFFRQKETLQLVLGGAAGNKVEQVDNDILLENMDRWVEQCTFFSSLNPTISNGDGIYSVDTSGISFPGLIVSSVALIGVTVSPADNQCQFVLISTEQVVKGSKLLVWIFNKLTGNTKTPDGDNSQQAIRSLSQLTFRPISDQDTAIFLLQTSLEISLKFPSFLLKILPVSKEKAEEQGSASVLKTLEKDTSTVAPKISKVYLGWLEQS